MSLVVMLMPCLTRMRPLSESGGLACVGDWMNNTDSNKRVFLVYKVKALAGDAHEQMDQSHETERDLSKEHIHPPIQKSEIPWPSPLHSLT